MKKFIIGVVVIVAVVALGIKGKGLLDKRTAEVEETPLPVVVSVTVKTTNAKHGTLSNETSLLAQILPQKSIKLSSKLAGYIQSISVEEGQKISKGDLLVQIDSEEIRSNIQSLQSALQTQRNDLKLAKTIQEGNMKLYEIGGLPREKLELFDLSLQAKQSTIDNTVQKIAQLEHQLTYLSILAPFDGQIDAILLQQGDLAVTAKPIMSISTPEKKLMLSYASNRDNHLKVGDKVFWNHVDIGNISTLYSTSKNGLSTAEVVLSKTIDVPTGSSINVSVLTETVSGCMVPNNTLLHKQDGVFVMEYINKVFKPTSVDVIIEDEDFSIVSPCPSRPIAQANETILSSLGAYKHVKVIGDTNVE